MTDADPLLAFITARLDEAEATARAVTTTGNSLAWTLPASATVDLGTGDIADLLLTNDATVARHIAAHDPAAVLRDVQATRGILALHEETGHYDCRACREIDGDWPCRTVRLIASRWATHPDYQPEWTPRDEPAVRLFVDPATVAEARGYLTDAQRAAIFTFGGQAQPDR